MRQVSNVIAGDFVKEVMRYTRIQSSDFIKVRYYFVAVQFPYINIKEARGHWSSVVYVVCPCHHCQ